MNTLAMLIDDTEFYSERWTLVARCVFFPPLVILLSWALIRWKKTFAVFALVAATSAAWMILSRMHDQLRRFEVVRTMHPNETIDAPFTEMVAPWFAAIFPFVMVLLFYVTARRPNQPPEPTAMSVTPPAAQESRQP